MPIPQCEVVDWTAPEENMFCTAYLAKTISMVDWREVPKNESMRLCKVGVLRG
jgi:hypothetical protein